MTFDHAALVRGVSDWSWDAVLAEPECVGG